MSTKRNIIVAYERDKPVGRDVAELARSHAKFGDMLVFYACSSTGDKTICGEVTSDHTHLIIIGTPSLAYPLDANERKFDGVTINYASEAVFLKAFNGYDKEVKPEPAPQKTSVPDNEKLPSSGSSDPAVPVPTVPKPVVGAVPPKPQLQGN